MSVWSGWQDDLLRAAKFPTSAANAAFLTAWHDHATSDCRNNPVDISKQHGGWSACKHLDPGRTANNYQRPSDAATAFADQVFGSEFIYLNSGFEGSSLSVANAAQNVIDEIRLWGSAAFADYLQAQGARGGAGQASHTHRGYADLNRATTAALLASRDAARELAAATRRLHRGHRVAH